MSFKNWVKGATRVKFDSHTLGNLVRNGGLAAGTLVGGPLGAAIAGGVSAARTAARPGANFGDIVKSGVGDASTAYGLHAAGGALRNAATGVTGGGSGTVTSAGGEIPGAAADVPMIGEPGYVVPGTGAPVAPPSVLGRAARGVGGFIEHHPQATATGLQAFGNLSTADSANRRNQAETKLLEQQLGESDYAFQRRKAQDLALEPLRRALAGNMQPIATGY